MELWSLLSITAPGLFPDPKRFAEHYARPIERGGDAERLARLRRRIKPLIMRRTKEPSPRDLPAEAGAGPRGRAAPAPPQALRHATCSASGRRSSACSTTSTATGSRSCARSRCCASSACTRRWSTSGTTPCPCAKLDALVEQLGEVVDEGHRALVFSQFTGFLAKVRERLDAEGIGYCYLDGAHAPARARARALQGRRRPGVPHQPQGRRLRPQPHRGRLLLPARPVVEPRHRGPGHRPHPPHRPDPPGHGLPARRPRHDRGEGHGARRTARPRCSAASWTTATCSPAASPPTTSAGCSADRRSRRRPLAHVVIPVDGAEESRTSIARFGLQPSGGQWPGRRLRRYECRSLAPSSPGCRRFFRSESQPHQCRFAGWKREPGDVGHGPLRFVRHECQPAVKSRVPQAGESDSERRRLPRRSRSAASHGKQEPGKRRASGEASDHTLCIAPPARGIHGAVSRSGRSPLSTG